MSRAPYTPVSNRPSPGELDVIQSVLEVVDRRGREMDEKWGYGRLPSLVSVEWAAKFRIQSAKFSDAVRAWECHEVRKHGEAMERAYAKLDEMATAAGHMPGPAEQWEFATPDGLVILVQDRARMNQVERHGRQCQVWSLDEIAEVVRKHPTIVVVKNEFPGAEVQCIRPAKKIEQDLNDSLEGLPFA